MSWTSLCLNSKSSRTTQALSLYKSNPFFQGHIENFFSYGFFRQTHHLIIVLESLWPLAVYWPVNLIITRHLNNDNNLFCISQPHKTPSRCFWPGSLCTCRAQSPWMGGLVLRSFWIQVSCTHSNIRTHLCVHSSHSGSYFFLMMKSEFLFQVSSQ